MWATRLGIGHCYPTLVSVSAMRALGGFLNGLRVTVLVHRLPPVLSICEYGQWYSFGKQGHRVAVTGGEKQPLSGIIVATRE